MERDEVARQAWVDHATTLPARRVTVVDETSTHLDMSSRYARAPRGQRAFAQQRRNYGKNVTLLAGLRLDGMCAPFVVEGGVDTAVFETYVTHVLLPTLRRGDIVVLDNLPVHKTLQVRGLFLAKGVKLLFLPAYSPDLSPIENAFAKLKALLRRARAQTVEALTEAIAQALASVSPYDAIGYFINAGLLNLDQ